MKLWNKRRKETSKPPSTPPTTSSSKPSEPENKRPQSAPQPTDSATSPSPSSSSLTLWQIQNNLARLSEASLYIDLTEANLKELILPHRTRTIAALLAGLEVVHDLLNYLRTETHALTPREKLM